MNDRGSLLEFLRAQGLRPAQACVVRVRFDSWLRKNKRQPVPVARRSAPPAKVYAFADLMPAWSDYQAMRAALGRGIS